MIIMAVGPAHGRRACLRRGPSFPPARRLRHYFPFSVAAQEAGRGSSQTGTAPLAYYSLAAFALPTRVKE